MLIAFVAPSDHPPSLYLEPLQSLSSATLPLLAALHPSLSQADLALLHNDYEIENRKLEQAVREAGLEGYAKEIVRLLRADEMEKEGSDEIIMVD